MPLSLRRTARPDARSLARRLAFTALWIAVTLQSPAPLAREPLPGPVAAAGAAVALPDPVPGESFRKPQFRRGDPTVDGRIDISDPVFELFHIFLGTADLACPAAADVNADGAIDITDPVMALEHLFLGGAPPPPPGPDACGVDPAPGWLPCEGYDLCPNDLPLISHVLNRITFGPSEALLTRIQTRDDLVAYIEEQLAAPDPYEQTVHEPALAAANAALGIGFVPDGTPADQVERLEALVLQDAIESEWQLLQVVTLFWNNHFHTQIDALRNNFFGRGPQGGGALGVSPEMFDDVDTDGSNTISESEWNAFRAAHPNAIAFSLFGRSTQDGQLTRTEFLARGAVGYWKYWRLNDQLGIAAEMELREYVLLRRLAFGRFRDLLRASATSVAMLVYLNTHENTVQAPNENYAREFLELSSLGADHVYTQRDIEELARILTGWTVDRVRRDAFDPQDITLGRNPGAPVFNYAQREPAPHRFPTMAYWDDSDYTWAFIFGHRNVRRLPGWGHDWGRKDLFLSRHGGVDSLGNPLPPAAQVIVPANDTFRDAAAAMAEFEPILDRVVGFRDCAKFISTKLIQLLVTDDLSALPRSRPMPQDLSSAFAAVDLDADGYIEPPEWERPIPLVLPGGRPSEIFERLDLDGDGRISRLEYREPDLLLDAIDTWRRTGGEIREVLRTILLSDEFLSLEFRRAKVKTPLELITSTVRALGGEMGLAQLTRASRDMQLAGMELFNFADPTGESELAIDWMHTVGLLERLKFIHRGANPVSTQDRRFNWNPWDLRRRWQLTGAESTVDFLALVIHQGDILENHRALALEVYRSAENAPEAIRATAAFLLSLPQFQKQ